MSDDVPQTPVLSLRRPEDRASEILAEKDPAAAVQALPVSDLYHLVKDLGLEDAHELIALASPDQFQGLLDLDVWAVERLDDAAVERLDDAAVRPWLEALVAAGP